MGLVDGVVLLGVGGGGLVANLLTALIAHQTRRHGHLLNMPWIHHRCNIQSAANISFYPLCLCLCLGFTILWPRNSAAVEP